MNARQAIGQRLVFGFHGTSVPDDFRALAREYAVGNVILFQYNIESAEQTRRLCAELQALIREATGQPAFITIDQEGGMVSRVPADAVNVPGAMALAATGDPDSAYAAARVTARQLRGLGVNFNLATDLDVNSNPLNPVIGARSFGDDAARVAAFGAASARGYRDGGVLCCGKHFPGHGDTAVDSHVGLPTVNKSLDELRAVELKPFAAAIDAGLPAVMSSHILFPQLEPDGVPATMSRRIMHGLLRDELGFAGLILSDCMVMDAIRRYYGTPAGVVAAMKAGVDMVFVCHEPELQRASAEAALQALESGALPDHDASLARILEAKARYAFATAEPELVNLPDDRQTARALARKALTLVSGALPRPTARTFFCGCADCRASKAANADNAAPVFPIDMQRRFGGDAFVSDARPDEAQIAAAVERARRADAIVLSTCNAHLLREQLALANALAATGLPMVVAALRNPYDLPLLPDSIAKLAAFDYSADALDAIAEALAGGACTGVSPVRLG